MFKKGVQHKKKPPVKPSERIKKVFEDTMLSDKPLPVAVAMRKHGYTPSSAKNPHTLKRSDTWIALLDKYGLSDEKLAEKHQKFLDSTNENIGIKALDIAYKVKGKYDNGHGISFNAPVQINIGTIDDTTPPQDTAQ